MNNEKKTRSIVVLYVATITGIEISGLTLSVPSSANSLHQIGVTIGLLTTASSGRYSLPEPYPVFYIKDLPFYAAISAMPKPFNQPDLIVFQSIYYPVHALLAHEAYRRKIPYIICPRSGMTRAGQQQKRWKKVAGNLLFFNWMVRHAAALHSLTDMEAVDIKAWNRPTFVVGNGVNLPAIEFHTFPGKHEILKFVFIGRLDINQKGLDLLLSACAIAQIDLRKANVKVDLYGPDWNGDSRVINELIENYQIQDFVNLRDPILGEFKQKVLQEADLFLHTSRFEGHSMAVLEALSYGVPCLLTPGTNVANEVADNYAGWSVEANPAAIAEGMRAVLADRSEIPKRGQAARNLVEKKYTWEQVGSQLLKEYTKIIESCHS